MVYGLGCRIKGSGLQVQYLVLGALDLVFRVRVYG
jgi:hypothetical protein